MARAEGDFAICESYERDTPALEMYPDEEYSDESINVGCVSSWSINDGPNHRTVVNVIISDGGFHYNSEIARCPDGRLQQMIRRLRQAESGASLQGRIGEGSRFAARAVRATLRDYDEEAQRVISPFSRKWDPPKWKKDRNL